MCDIGLLKFSALHVFLDHPWIQIDGEAPDKPLDSVVLIRMKQFRAMNKLKKLALKVMCMDDA